jgi:UDP-glucose 4-epimerase
VHTVILLKEGRLAEKILVTGGAGYVGSVCVALLREKDYEVVIYDNLSAGHREAVTGGAKLEVGDLADRARLTEVFATHTPDFVMHFAASCLVGESYHDPILYYRNNVANAANLVDVMIEHDVRAIIFSSSCAVYGEPVRVPMTEDDPKNPINPYGKTKLTFEHLLEDCDAAHGLKSVALRYFNAAGATDELGEDHDPETHLIPIVLKVPLGLLDGVEVFGDDYPTPDGTCVRDYVHVSDLAAAHESALGILRQGKSERINLGNGNGFSVLDVIRASEHVTGKNIPSKVSPRRRGDPAALVAGAGKAADVLGWQPSYTSLETIIETAWKWHKEHPHGYRD